MLDRLGKREPYRLHTAATGAVTLARVSSSWNTPSNSYPLFLSDRLAILVKFPPQIKLRRNMPRCFVARGLCPLISVVGGSRLTLPSDTPEPSITVGSADGFVVAPGADPSVRVVIGRPAAAGNESVLDAFILSIFQVLTTIKLRRQRSMFLSEALIACPYIRRLRLEFDLSPESLIETLRPGFSGGGASDL